MPLVVPYGMEAGVHYGVPSVLLRTSNVLSFLLLIAVNVGSSMGLFGPTNVEVSGRWPTPLTPAG